MLEESLSSNMGLAFFCVVLESTVVTFLKPYCAFIINIPIWTLSRPFFWVLSQVLRPSCNVPLLSAEAAWSEPTDERPWEDTMIYSPCTACSLFSVSNGTSPVDCSPKWYLAIPSYCLWGEGMITCLRKQERYSNTASKMKFCMVSSDELKRTKG